MAMVLAKPCKARKSAVGGKLVGWAGPSCVLDPLAEKKERLVTLLKARWGRSGRSPEAPMVESLQRAFGFAERAWDQLGVVGARRVSCFGSDSFASLCGRHQVIARDEFVVSGHPTTSFHKDPEMGSYVSM